MKYEVKAIIKIKFTVDADNEDTASEIADITLNDAYDDDVYYEIETVTKLEEE